MAWGSAHQEAIVLAADAREQLSIDAFERIDAFEAIVASGVKLLFRPLKAVAGFYEPAHEHGRAGVLINARHPLALQRYSASHELGHHMFGHGRQVDREGEPSRSRPTSTPEEQRAEAFAAWFLMPPETANNALLRLGLERPATALDAYELALRLGVSFRAMCTHLPSLGLVRRGVSDAWSDVPLKSLKQQKTDDAPASGWANDVWRLSRAETEATLVMRAGDCILFDLPGAIAVAASPGVQLADVPARDLLSTPGVRADIGVDCLPGPAQITVECEAQALRFDFMVERPLRGLYLSRLAAAR